MQKYALLHAMLVAERVITNADVHEPAEAEWESIALAHDPEYVAKLRDGTLSIAEERRIGFPWSAALLRRARLAVQGTIDAAVMAIESPHRIAGNLAGGTHHALPDAGEGYCALNDVSIAVRWLRREGFIGRALVCDLDVHHGNGNAVAFAADDGTFTFSMHGARNFPLRKPPSSLDIPLEDGTNDDRYLELLSTHLPRTLDDFRPELVFFLAGVDVVAGDRFGRLALTEAGLARRERLVIKEVAGRGIPLCIVLAGGYAPTPVRTAELHAVVLREVERWLGSGRFARGG